MVETNKCKAANSPTKLIKTTKEARPTLTGYDFAQNMQASETTEALILDFDYHYPRLLEMNSIHI